jgi:uncharacterized protein (TIGR02466 family)
VGTANVTLIFPTPVMTLDMDRPFTYEELEFCQPEAHELSQNIGNKHTKDSYILEHPAMADIKKACLDAVNVYIQNIYKPRAEITPYITQSWLNYTTKGQFMHKHHHANSFLSGVIYIRADENTDTINFHDQTLRQITFPAKEYDIMNSESWWFPVKTGTIIIFPSGTTHSVDEVKTDDTRISLAFNSFIDGTLGCHDRLTELKLKNVAK